MATKLFNVKRIKSRVELFVEEKVSNFDTLESVHIDVNFRGGVLLGEFYVMTSELGNWEFMKLKTILEFQQAMAFQTYFIKLKKGLIQHASKK